MDVELDVGQGLDLAPFTLNDFPMPEMEALTLVADVGFTSTPAVGGVTVITDLSDWTCRRCGW